MLDQKLELGHCVYIDAAKLLKTLYIPTESNYPVHVRREQDMLRTVFKTILGH